MTEGSGDNFKINKVSKVSQTVEAFRKHVEGYSDQHGVMPADPSRFETLMDLQKGPPPTPIMTENGHSLPSLFDEVGKVERAGNAVQKTSSIDLISQTQKTIAKIDELKAQLSAPELGIKVGTRKLLDNKLSNVNESLKIAFAKAGIEYIPPERQFGTQNPVKQFLTYLSDGQSGLERLGNHVEALAAMGTEITAPQLLAIQLKVNHVQQELEFFSGLLNKALESTKTVMNVQV